MKLTVCILIALFALMLAVMLCYAAPYQSYKQDKCAICLRSNVRLVVHHVEPQHLHPELRDDHPENYVTLCDPFLRRSSGCHWKYGHRGISWDYDNSEMLKLILKYIDGKGQDK